MEALPPAEATEAAIKVNQGLAMLTHIAERRIEYLLGTLIAYQLGLLDKLVTYGSSCIA